MKSIDVITLGCAKNLVDSERLLKMLSDNGFKPRHDPDESLEPSSIVVINTCGFIADAKMESIETILRYAAAKDEGKVEKLIVMGCLSERYKNELPEQLPEVDSFYGKFDWDKMVADLVRNVKNDDSYSRIITTKPSHAYIKIAEGCNRFCAFCAIPLITGRYKSRSIEEIVAEVKSLTQQGITEFNIIAQDLSSYGVELYGNHRLADLVNAISEIEAVKWIRLHYAYPADFPYDILPVIRENPKVCKYLDIALQHISDPVLANMRRHFSKEDTIELVNRIRREVPGIHLRTTLMVGFPGEGRKEFNELMNYVSEARFERMGAFAYSEEDDTYAAKNFKDSIDKRTKSRRLDKIMALQEEIAMELQLEKVGSIQAVVIDREEDEYYVGRTQYDSPEVDPEVFVDKRKKLQLGNYYKVKIEKTLPFELFGTLAQ